MSKNGHLDRCFAAWVNRRGYERRPYGDAHKALLAVRRECIDLLERYAGKPQFYSLVVSFHELGVEIGSQAPLHRDCLHGVKAYLSFLLGKGRFAGAREAVDWLDGQVPHPHHGGER